MINQQCAGSSGWGLLEDMLAQSSFMRNVEGC
jgi:hypothetical protein